MPNLFHYFCTGAWIYLEKVNFEITISNYISGVLRISVVSGGLGTSDKEASCSLFGMGLQ